GLPPLIFFSMALATQRGRTAPQISCNSSIRVVGEGTRLEDASPRRIGRPRIRRIQQAANEVISMSRIPAHTVEDAPAASRPLLQKIVQSTPTGRLANLHSQMAPSPAVLTAYASLRAVLAEHTTFDPKVGAALTLAAAAGVGNGYMIRIASRLAQMNGWTEEQVAALTAVLPTNDAKIDVLA